MNDIMIGMMEIQGMNLFPYLSYHYIIHILFFLEEYSRLFTLYGMVARVAL